MENTESTIEVVTVAETTVEATEPDTLSFWDEKLGPDDAILCRNTKPLVEMAYNLLRNGVACRVEGRDIGNGLITLAQKWKISKLTALQDKIVAWRDRETQKWQAKGKDAQAAAIEDKAETILCIIESLLNDGKREVRDLVDFIKSLFEDTGEKKQVLTLCTIHRSKGREWNRVFWLRPDLCPSKWARSAWQLEQEQNLMYVAVTRAKCELIKVEL